MGFIASICPWHLSQKWGEGEIKLYFSANHSGPCQTSFNTVYYCQLKIINSAIHKKVMRILSVTVKLAAKYNMDIDRWIKINLIKLLALMQIAPMNVTLFWTVLLLGKKGTDLPLKCFRLSSTLNHHWVSQATKAIGWFSYPVIGLARADSSKNNTSSDP